MTENQPEKKSELDRLTRARRRRARRMRAERRDDRRVYFLNELSGQAATSIEFLLSALIAGTLIGAGFRFNQRVLLIAAVLLAPRMAPVLGFAMASILGRVGPLLRGLFNLLVMLLIVMISAGLVGGMESGSEVFQGILLQYTQLNILDFVFVALASMVLATLVVQDGVFSPLPSAAVAYEILLPLGASAIGMMGLEEQVWRGALLNFGVHLTWSLVSGMVVFLVMGYRPVSSGVSNYFVAILSMSLVVIVSLLSLGASILVEFPSSTPAVVAQPASPTTTGTPTTTQTPSSTPTLTPTAIPPTETPRPPTSTPTPAIGVVVGTGGLGVVIRDSPNGLRLGGLLDGDEVELIGGPLQVEGLTWWKIRTEEGIEAWMTGTYMATATPGP